MGLKKLTTVEVIPPAEAGTPGTPGIPGYCYETAPPDEPASSNEGSCYFVTTVTGEVVVFCRDATGEFRL